MAENTDDVQVTLDEGANRFDLSVGGEPAGVAKFVAHGDQWVFTHTVVDDAFGGRGLGSTLVRQALDTTREQGKRIVPVCPFVVAYLKKHDDWADLVDQPNDELLASLPE
jgi:predicted GNAT family acetyltransferase